MNINEINKYYIYVYISFLSYVNVKIVKINACLHAWSFEFFSKFKFKFEILIS